MSETRLETTMAMLTRLAGLADDKQALAEDLFKLVERYECMFCGELAKDTVSLCQTCEDAPKCSRCSDPCPDGFTDKENDHCEGCWDDYVAEETRRKHNHRSLSETRACARRNPFGECASELANHERDLAKDRMGDDR